jgi:hypothetical protein
MTTIACKCCCGLGAAVAVLIGGLWAAQVQASDYDAGSIHIAQPWGGQRRREQNQALAT